MEYQTMITAAGDSRREFLADGANLPKSLTEIEGEPLIVKSIHSYSHNSGTLVVALNAEENQQFGISQVVKESFPKAGVVDVSSSVRGALATAVLAAGSLDLSAPLVISAGDSTIDGGVEKHIDSLISKDSDAGTVVFRSSNARWSYINVGSIGNVLQVTEKSVAGPYATVGCFYFRSAKLFLDAAQWVFLNNAGLNGNFYVSTSLNYLISKGLSVNFEVIPRGLYRSYSKRSDFLRQEE